MDNSPLQVAELCLICNQDFTTVGDHRIASLKCGHFFGFKCIMELLKGCDKTEKKCIVCDKNADVDDIRMHFATKIKPIDRAKIEETNLKVLEMSKKCKELEERCVVMQRKNNEIKKAILREDKKSPKKYIMFSTVDSISLNLSGFKLLGYNDQKNVVYATSSTNSSSFNVLKITPAPLKTLSTFAEFSKNNIRAIVPCPSKPDCIAVLYDGEVAISCNLQTTDVVYPVNGPWCACWLNMNTLAVGTQTGRVQVFNKHSNSSEDVTQGIGDLRIFFVAAFDKGNALIVGALRTCYAYFYSKYVKVLDAHDDRFYKFNAFSLLPDEMKLGVTITDQHSPEVRTSHRCYKLIYDGNSIKCCELARFTRKSPIYPLFSPGLFPLDTSIFYVSPDPDAKRISVVDFNSEVHEQLIDLPHYGQIYQILPIHRGQQEVNIFILASTGVFSFIFKICPFLI